jgi:hypothetical protein
MYNIDKPERNRVIFKKAVKFVNGIRSDKDGDNFPIYKTINAVTTSIRLYDGTTTILANLSKCALHLILFCGEEMDEHGLVRNDSPTKKLFVTTIYNYTEGRVNYAETSIGMAFSELTKNGLLLPKAKGVFRVNPMYVWRNSPSNRLASIKEELESMSDKTFNIVVKPILGLQDHDEEKD